jgi:hypothetical protein
VLARHGSGRRTARRAALGAVAASVAVVGLPTPAQAALPTTPFVSEFHYDNAGTDAGEFVEVTLPAGTSSDGLAVVLYNGSNGASYATLALPGVTAPATGPVAVSVDAPGMQNGAPDGVALVQGATVLDALSYEGSFTATGGPAAGQVLPDIGVSEAGSDPEGLSLSRRFDAAGNGAWYPPAPHTRGQVNPAFQAPDACDVEPTHEIGQVQGSGASTPLGGQQVTVRGVVVGDLPGLSGFYLQDADGDGDSATSDGIFVESGVPVDLGDTVAVTGAPARTSRRRRSPRARTSPSARTAPGPTCPLPHRSSCRPPTPSASRSRACW